jgi:hypothetical protein
MSKMIDSLGHKRWLNAAREYHRLDGPEIEYSNGDAEMWAINGIMYWNFKDFQADGNLTDDQMTILRLKYGAITKPYK